MGHGEKLGSGAQCNIRMEDVIILLDEKMAAITKEEWKNCCEEKKRTEKEYFEKEGLLDEGLELVIHLGVPTYTLINTCYFLSF